jgi:ATP-dependent DNA helicase RecQ
MADTILDPTTLLSRFGLSSFRPGQREVIDSLAAGEDVMCVMPTGGGKSLCYQLPSLAREGTTIVVSPLIALMKDQVDTLTRRGIDAKLINSSLSASEQSEVMSEMAAGTLDLVYVAPERLRNGRFLEAVSSANVTLLAVDEAHCVSEWGHDFRPDYSRLGRFRTKYLGDVQTIALTATATPMVRDDISELLGLKSPRAFVTGFARENLRFSVIQAKSDREKDERLTSYLAGQSGAGIIYAATRRRCEELAEWLPQKVRRPIGVYHAGLEPQQRRQVQEDFMSGKLDAIVATNAFGMGIDKSNIRFVIHYNMPGSLEAYYQEAGRAGRDGQSSDCLLLFSYNDRYIQEFFIENRYPSRETVCKVYEYLLSREEDPIEMTLDQVRAAINVTDGTEAVGTAQTLLAKAGVLKRLDSNSNQAMVRIDSTAPTMLDFLPKEAKIRRRVMQAIEKVVGRRRGDDVFVRPHRLMELAEVDREQLTRTLRELNKLKAFDYVPPFRGRAVHFTDRDLPFESLEIDFDELGRRKQAEFEKLEAVIGFARTPSCRQRVILNYFGDPSRKDCGSCDRCDDATANSLRRGTDVSVGEVKGVESESLTRGVRVVLSGVTRMHGRFGKNLVAQMLCGSKNKKLQQWKLHRLSTYGLLSSLRQSEIVAVMDSLIEAGLLEQKEVDQRRPTIHISALGKRVMHAQEALPAAVRMPFPLAKRLAAASRSLESGDVQTSSAGDSDAVADDAQSQEVEDLIARLKRWRHKTSAALGMPAYRVLTNATIDRIAQASPRDSEQLEAISGVGPATIEQFGYDIISIVGRADSEAERADSGAEGESKADEQSPPPNDCDMANDIQRRGSAERADQRLAAEETPAQPVVEPPAILSAVGGEVPSEPRGDRLTDRGAGERDDSQSAYWTWRLFRDGYSPSQIALIRRCETSELIDDLVLAIQAGHPVDPSWASGIEGMRRVHDAISDAKNR